MSHDTNEWKTIEQCVKAFTNCTQIALLIGIYIFKRYDLLLRPDSGKYHLAEELQNKTNDVTITRKEVASGWSRHYGQCRLNASNLVTSRFISITFLLSNVGNKKKN